MSYDSTEDTLVHIGTVQLNMVEVLVNLRRRNRLHDKSKLESPEKEMFDEWTPKLREMTYGSDEYKDALKQMGLALDHHYQANSHHPEHFGQGIAGMSLLDLIEMLCDWRAATLRHADGDLAKSLEYNKTRFGISEQLASVLENTARELGWVTCENGNSHNQS